MFVCSCRAVTDRTVDACIDDGATCIEEIAQMCGAGSRCGGCWPELERLLEVRPEATSRPRRHLHIAVA